MAESRPAFFAFNRGRISRLGLARTDLERTRLSAEIQTNWMPRTLGSMMLRPGLGYLGGILDNSSGRLLPFIVGSTDKAVIEITDRVMRVWSSGTALQRFDVSSTFANGDFSSSLNSWTDADDAGSTSSWNANERLILQGNRYAYARRRQAVAIASSDQNTEHGVSLRVTRGLLTFRGGSSTGADDLISERVLRPGWYSFGTSMGSSELCIELAANTEYQTRVNFIEIDQAGDLTVTTPWESTDLDRLRHDQAENIIYGVCNGYEPHRIERFSDDSRSWGVGQYFPVNGPFRTPNITTKRLTPSAVTGRITVTADPGTFRSGQEDGLIQITSVGQTVEGTFNGPDQWTDSIRISGIESGRQFRALVSDLAGSTVARVRVQRSLGVEGAWTNINGLRWATTNDEDYLDGLDNQIAFYRIGVDSTDYNSTNSETATASLIYEAGGRTGVVHIDSIQASSEITASVLLSLGSTVPTELWSEGEWSNYRGWPTAGAIAESRFCLGGRGKLWASVVGSYESHDPDFIGDAGPINRSLGSGANDTVEWLLDLNRLLIGTQGREVQAKTSALDEPLTPSNFAPRNIATQGSAGVQAVKIDERAFFVQAGTVRIFEISAGQSGLNYLPIDRTLLVPEVGDPGIVALGVQRQPDTRLHAVRSDGTVAVFVNDAAEDVNAWIDVETDGAVEDVCVLPGPIEDEVYYLVRREINGSTVRNLERWAHESEARGDSTNKIADCFKTFNATGGAVTLITGATHLIGATNVVLWGNGKDLGSTFVVNNDGEISAPEASTSFYYGLPYTAHFKSAKLAYGARGGTALTQKKQIKSLGAVLADAHILGLQFGQSTARLDRIPLGGHSTSVTTDTVFAEFEQSPVMFPGPWDTDARLHLIGVAPRPVTVLAGVIEIDTKEQ